MTTRMQQRRGTAAEWAAVNPILAAGEIGIETDTGVVKVGNGTSTWANLKSPYLFKTGGTIKALTKDDVSLTLQANTNQAVDILRITDVNGTVLARWTKDGKYYETGSENVTAKGDLLVGTGVDAQKRLPVGSDALALLADASTPTGLRWGAVGKAADVQVFTASGTWTKPANARFIVAICIGGGMGGQAVSSSQTNYISTIGGQGGARTRGEFLPAALGATVPVVVGAGGPGQLTTWNAVGSTAILGGDSVFGPLRARGGGQSGPGDVSPGGGGSTNNGTPNAAYPFSPGGGAGAGIGVPVSEGSSSQGTTRTARSASGLGGDGGYSAMANPGNATGGDGSVPGGGGGGAAARWTYDGDGQYTGGGTARGGNGARGEVIVVTLF